jgi:glycosyltransferase involved in cell wall biosynthesis
VSPAETLRGRDIVCVGFNDWDNDVWTNQHHLMSRLAADNRVLFVESLGLRRPQLAGRDLRRIARRVRRGLGPPRRRDGLWVVSPLVLPLHGNRAVRALNARLLSALVRRAARAAGIRRPILWSYVPQAEPLVGALDPALVVYHCVDDIAAQKGVDADSFRAAERRFVERADLVLASAPGLAERLRPNARRVVYAPNVADTGLFATALDRSGPIDPAVAALPRPRIAFHGAIVATKLDLGLIVDLARLHRDWSIVLVGPEGLGDPTSDVGALRGEPNIHLLGPRAHHALPAVLAGADAAIIPYGLNELTAHVFPMKVYEYMAAGLPVVTTPLPSLEGVDGVIRAADAPAMAAALEAAMAADGEATRAARSAAAAAHSWEARLAEIAAAVSEAEAGR